MEVWKGLEDAAKELANPVGRRRIDLPANVLAAARAPAGDCGVDVVGYQGVEVSLGNFGRDGCVYFAADM